MFNFLKEKLTKWNRCPEIIEVERVYGGDINESFKLLTSSQSFFVKVQRYGIPDLFEKESLGLNLLRNSQFLVPEVHYFDERVLVLSWMEKSTITDSYYEAAGKALANLHQISQDQYGLDHNNYIGSLPQKNDITHSWVEFFVTHRIEPQVKMAVDEGVWNTEMVRKFTRLYNELENLIPSEKPALVHGDLWSGNIMATADARPVIYDPAVYFGHREMDLAMTHLFGGFSPVFYEAYESEFPLEPSFEQRLPIHQLYPILVHVNLFGGGYKKQAESIVLKFI